ncbi:hypothetical protein C6501_05475 [Candidatus Poribacteria bacterium]|nr:MAG: hypothetical protein C6501_05475 [Candidatus Poribacteria bacterium]
MAGGKLCRSRNHIGGLCVSKKHTALAVVSITCNATQRFISDYIDGTLSTRDTAKVEAHLQLCLVCQHEANALKKTRDLVVNFYVEPEAPDNYYHQFEVELHRCIENKGPTPLKQRLKTSALQFTWSLLTQLRQSFGRYSFIRMNAFPLGMLFVLIVAGFVVTHLPKQEVSLPPKVYLQEIDEHANGDEKSELRHGIYNDRKAKRAALSEVSSTTSATDVEKVGYWKLTDPLTTETEGHIIVMHIDNDRSVPNDTVPNDTVGSELIVYAQPDILSRKSPLQDANYAALPLELQVAPFSEKYKRKHRRFPRFVDKLMNVPSEVLSIPAIPELYNASKL